MILCSLAVSIYGQTTSDSIAIVSAHWETTVASDGIIHKRAVISDLYKGPQYINLIEIPSSRKLHYDIAISEMKQTSLISKEHQALASINGSFYNMKEGFSVCYLGKGKEVVDTTENNLFARCTGAIHVHKKKVRILPWSKDIETKYKQKKGATLASGPLLMQNGACVWNDENDSFNSTKHPRSAIFTTKEKKTVFITVDGRRKGNATGVSIAELTHLIRILGGHDALNLDGGGSTTLWMEGAPENGVLNSPSDNGKFDHQGERKIPNIIYVYKH
jgi:exopolysaccharide biosynthesis protein